MTRKMNDPSDRIARTAVMAKTAYEGSVVARAMQRAGRNVNLKGHVHEVLVKDMRNLNPINLLSRQTSELTRSTTAKTVDIVTTRGGKVVERLQIKDAPASIGKLVRQVKSGQYSSARLIGSKETAEAYNTAAKAQGLSKTMGSSGISSRTTERLAQSAGATGSGTLNGAMVNAAKSGGAVGAVVGAGIEAVRGVRDLYNGERTLGEVAVSTAKAGAKGGASGAAAGVAATATGGLVSAGLVAAGVTGATALVATALAPITVAAAVGYGVGKLWDALFK